MTTAPTPSPRRPGDCPRRAVLAGAAGLVLAWMTPIRAQEPQGPPPAVGDWLVKVGDSALIPLTPDDVPFDGAVLITQPMSPQGDTLKTGSLNRIAVARLNPTAMSDATRALAVDDVVAYSAICTHSGCEIDPSLGESQTFFCSCHQSMFDPRDSGAAIGGPAPRALPALPLKLVDGRLTVAASFTSPPGFGI